MTTTDLTAYADRLAALRKHTGAAVCVSMECWHHVAGNGLPQVTWSVYAGQPGKSYNAPSLEAALLSAELGVRAVHGTAEIVVTP